MLAAETLGTITASPAPGLQKALLGVDDLHVHFVTSRGVVRAVQGVSYAVSPGEMVAIVGESGSGKSVSALTVMRLLPEATARVVGGTIRFDGRNLLDLDEEGMREVRGRDIAMIFQEPMTSLNPVLPIGLQIKEPLFVHLGMNEAQAEARARELLELVGMTDPARRLAQYPHQLSGGMRQRVMIAIGLACNPKLLIADEPTTALDVTIQAQILELLKDLSRRLGIATIMITHNLGIVARYADRVNVMYAARIVESGTAEEVFARPRHPYTVGLLRSVPRLDRGRLEKLETIEGLPPNLLAMPSGCSFAPRCRFALDLCRGEPPALAQQGGGHLAACHRAQEMTAIEAPAAGAAAAAKGGGTGEPLVEVRDLWKRFQVSRGGLFGGDGAEVKAIAGVSLQIFKGETLGLVGESGCGKSTLGRLILRLDDPSEGSITIDGQDLFALDRRRLKLLRQGVQVIFQDPYSSLNPRMTIGQIISEPMAVHGIEKGRARLRERVAELLELVGLYPYMAERYPHELSGGQRQRVGIARALAMKPRFIVCDEAVSALDVSIQGQIINLLEELQERLGLTYLFIAHDLAVVRHIATRVAVMYLGKVVEVADCDTLYADPKHPYTQALLQAAPIPDPRVERERPRAILHGELPSPLSPPSGCVFHPRCPIATDACWQEVPQLKPVGSRHEAACLLA